ncbi:phosphocholine-specific phospholipase C [Streptomyces sp. NPDC020800]|uniref:phosphocholine-specific phospholipase C n=1 Tax=Streptomyces sp. NPDC020800 TaxID=3365092 RepID=UPI00379B65D4
MANFSRRALLTSATAVAMGAVVSRIPRTGMPGETIGTKPVAATLSTPDPQLSPIKHVVVLMQENRSFDHYFGTLQGVRGFADKSIINRRGTSSAPSGKTIFEQPNGSGTIFPWRMNHDQAGDDWLRAQCAGDVDHGWFDQHDAWNDGFIDDWVDAKDTTRTMGYFTRADIPFHYGLADAYTVCDAYHCSVLGATGPNRTYLWSGSIGADVPGANYLAYDGGDFIGEDLTWSTYAEALQDAGVSWKVYQVRGNNYADNALEYFDTFAHAATSSTLYKRGIQGVDHTSGQDVADAILDAFESDVVDGTLPKVSWLVPNKDYTEHPDASASEGADFVKRVLEALNADEDVFNSTVVILNYDENGGFFDHVPPPVPADDSDDTEYITDSDNNRWPIGLGFRVPLIVVSPWTRGGWVNSEVFDHTSVLQFLEKWTGVECDLISTWRRKVCGDLTSAFDFDNPVYGLPDLPDPAPAGKDVATLPVCNAADNPSEPSSTSLPAQEEGTRQARALPYQPNAYLDTYTVSGSTIHANFNFENTGSQATRAAHFSFYINAYRSDTPSQYTVDADDTTSDYFNIGSGYGSGKYDFTVVGPNRFLRRFKGNASTATGRGARVKSYFADGGSGDLAIWFDLYNDNAAPVTFTLTSNQYRDIDPETVDVAAHSMGSDYFNQVTHADGWYDFTITVSNDSAWSQRFVGHIETGDPSITG